MTKEELMLIRDFVNENNFSEKTKAQINDIWDNCSDIVHLINSNDTRFIDYPQYWTREDVDGWLDKPLTDDEFNELSYDLSKQGSYDSDYILFAINEIRS